MMRGILTGSCAVVALAVGLSFSASAQALDFPALEVQDLSGDAGAASAAGTLSIDATATTLLLSSTPGDFIDIADEDFSLTATFVSANGSSATYAGTLSVGSLLTADFADLTIFPTFGGAALLSAQLSYTGGSLAGGYAGGTLEGSLASLASGDYLGDFAAGTVIAKIGPVVPIPAPIALLASALVPMALVARRRRGRTAA